MRSRQFNVDVKLAAPFRDRKEAFSEIKDLVRETFSDATSFSFRHKERGRAGSQPRYLQIKIDFDTKGPDQDPVLMERKLAGKFENAGFRASYKYRGTDKSYPCVYRRFGYGL